jgi:predicted amidophosphoribosyltransferase
MSDRHGGQMPCPDCGSPVRPQVDQLCPNCGYPLMFMREEAKVEEQRVVPRQPGEKAEPTGMVHTRSFATSTYGQPSALPPPVPAGQLSCPGCGYPNEQARIRCERCGRELRPARPNAVRLGPPPVEAPRNRWLIWLLIILGVLAVISIAAAVITYFWDSLAVT